MSEMKFVYLNEKKNKEFQLKKINILNFNVYKYIINYCIFEYIIKLKKSYIYIIFENKLKI